MRTAQPGGPLIQDSQAAAENKNEDENQNLSTKEKKQLRRALNEFSKELERRMTKKTPQV